MIAINVSCCETCPFFIREYDSTDNGECWLMQPEASGVMPNGSTWIRAYVLENDTSKDVSKRCPLSLDEVVIRHKGES